MGNASNGLKTKRNFSRGSVWVTDGFSLCYFTLSVCCLKGIHDRFFSMNVLTETTIAGLGGFHSKNRVCVCLPALCVHACVCMHSVQKQLRPCVAQTATTGRWVEYEFTSDETSPTVRLQRLLFIVSLLDTSSDLKVNFNISYPIQKKKKTGKTGGPQTNCMMQKNLRRMSYINIQRYLILMHFSAVAMSVTLRDRLFMKCESKRNHPKISILTFLIDLTIDNTIWHVCLRLENVCMYACTDYHVTRL